ncbi:MAG: hypothetical protein IJ043_01985 [Clostridia bacterium]|nr:hypothetical protein [Clostridia bacterium]
MKLKIVGFNVQCGGNREERAPRVLAIIKEKDPDLIGFQEITPKWMELLASLDKEYGHILQYRHPESLEGTPLYWKKSVFELMEEKHFWLSETPNKPSKGWNSDYYRVCSYAALRHKETGKIIYFYNTHFDWVGCGPRESAQLIIRRAESHGDSPVFCTADYNFAPGSAGWHSMRSWFRDVREDVAPDNKLATIHSYKNRGECESCIIDYCFYHGKGVKPTDYEVVNRSFDGQFASDHHAMYYEFEVE